MKGFRKILQLCCRFERQEVNIEAESVDFCFRLPLKVASPKHNKTKTNALKDNHQKFNSKV